MNGILPCDRDTCAGEEESVSRAAEEERREEEEKEKESGLLVDTGGDASSETRGDTNRDAEAKAAGVA